VLPQWQFQPGQHNAITDVPGVKVGHVTIRRDIPHTVRTGVTAIIPHAGNLATEAVWANGGWLNGNGELTGLGYLQETGLLTSPIMLTNTYSLGKVHDGVFEYFQRTAPGRWVGLLPVVGECYDGFFNTITDRSAISTDDVVRSIETAAAGPVLQGRVGAGTGMRSFELHAGIGSASRKIEVDGKPYHIGVLVNANHTNNKGLTHLDPVIRQKLEAQLGPLTQIKAEDATHKAVQPPVAPPRQGSIIVIIATDLPLGPHQLKELVNRAALGLGAMGSTMDTTSGDGVIAFSTAQRIPLEADGPNPSSLIPTTVMLHDALSPVYRATVEAVTEAQINALIASHSGSKGN
jgi:D-aminopeptidase